MADTPAEWEKKVRVFVKEMWGHIEEYDTLLTYNPIFMDRTKNIGTMTSEMALAWGVTGPNLRATVFSKGSCESSFRVMKPPGFQTQQILVSCYERSPGARPGLAELPQNTLRSAQLRLASSG